MIKQISYEIIVLSNGLMVIHISYFQDNVVNLTCFEKKHALNLFFELHFQMYKLQSQFFIT